MEEKYEKIRGLCKNIQFTKGKLSDEYLFTLDAVDTFFYKNNIGAMDIREGFTDGNNDGGDEKTQHQNQHGLHQGKGPLDAGLHFAVQDVGQLRHPHEAPTDVVEAEEGQEGRRDRGRGV